MILHLCLLLLCLPSFALLAMAMDRHQEDLFGEPLPPPFTRTLRRGGWALLLLALVVAVSAEGWGLGLVAYSGHTSFAAGVVLLTLVGLARRRQRGKGRAR